MYRPSISPTTFQPSVTFNASIVVNKVSQSFLSSDGIEAICATIAEVGRVAIYDVEYLGTIQVISGSFRGSLVATGAMNYDLQVLTRIILYLADYPEYQGNGLTAYNITVNRIQTAISTTTFTTTLRSKAVVYCATEVTQAEVKTPCIVSDPVISTDPSTTSSRDSNTNMSRGEIIGTVLGVSFGIAILLLALCGIDSACRARVLSQQQSAAGTMMAEDQRRNDSLIVSNVSLADPANLTMEDASKVIESTQETNSGGVKQSECDDADTQWSLL